MAPADVVELHPEQPRQTVLGFMKFLLEERFYRWVTLFLVASCWGFVLWFMVDARQNVILCVPAALFTLFVHDVPKWWRREQRTPMMEGPRPT